MKNQQQALNDQFAKLESRQTALAEENAAVETHPEDTAASNVKCEEDTRNLPTTKKTEEADRREMDAARSEIDAQRMELEEAMGEFRSEQESLQSRREELAKQAEQIEQERAAIREEQAKFTRFRNELSLGQVQVDADLEESTRNSIGEDGIETSASETNDADPESLRSTLATMFEIQESEISSRASKQAATDLEKQESQDAASPAGNNQEPEESTQPPQANDPDCVATYMEGLLARNRKDGAAPPAAKPAPPRPQPKSKSPTAKSNAPASSNSRVEAGQKDETKKPAKTPPPKRERPSKEELRADIDSFRELANLSAQSAVAKHGWKKLREELFAKTVLTAASVAVAGVLSTGVLGTQFYHPTFGGIAATLGVFLGFELFRSVRRLFSLKPKKMKN